MATEKKGRCTPAKKDLGKKDGTAKEGEGCGGAAPSTGGMSEVRSKKKQTGSL